VARIALQLPRIQSAARGVIAHPDACSLMRTNARALKQAPSDLGDYVEAEVLRGLKSQPSPPSANISSGRSLFEQQIRAGVGRLIRRATPMATAFHELAPRDRLELRVPRHAVAGALRAAERFDFCGCRRKPLGGRHAPTLPSTASTSRAEGRAAVDQLLPVIGQISGEAKFCPDTSWLRARAIRISA